MRVGLPNIGFSANQRRHQAAAGEVRTDVVEPQASAEERHREAVEQVAYSARVLLESPGEPEHDKLEPALLQLAAGPATDGAVEAAVKLTAAAFERSKKELASFYVARETTSFSGTTMLIEQFGDRPVRPDKAAKFQQLAGQTRNTLQAWQQQGHLSMDVSWAQFEEQAARVYLRGRMVKLRPEPSPAAANLLSDVKVERLHRRHFQYEEEIAVRPQIAALGELAQPRFNQLVDELIELAQPNSERTPLFVLNEVLRAARGDQKLAALVEGARPALNGLYQRLQQDDRRIALYDETGGELVMGVYDGLLALRPDPATTEALSAMAAGENWRLHERLDDLMVKYPDLTSPLTESALSCDSDYSLGQLALFRQAFAQGYPLDRKQTQLLLDRLLADDEGRLHSGTLSRDRGLASELMHHSHRHGWFDLKIGTTDLSDACLDFVCRQDYKTPDKAFASAISWGHEDLEQLALAPRMTAKILARLKPDTWDASQAQLLGRLTAISLEEPVWRERLQQLDQIPDELQRAQQAVYDEARELEQNLASPPDDFLGWVKDRLELKSRLRKSELPRDLVKAHQERLEAEVLERRHQLPVFEKLAQVSYDDLKEAQHFGEHLSRFEPWIERLAAPEIEAGKARFEAVSENLEAILEAGGPGAPAPELFLNLLATYESPSIVRHHAEALLKASDRQVSSLGNPKLADFCTRHLPGRFDAMVELAPHFQSLEEQLKPLVQEEEDPRLELLLQNLGRLEHLEGGIQSSLFQGFLKLLHGCPPEEVGELADRYFAYQGDHRELSNQAVRSGSLKAALDVLSLTLDKEEADFQSLEDGFLVGDTFLGR